MTRRNYTTLYSKDRLEQKDFSTDQSWRGFWSGDRSSLGRNSGTTEFLFTDPFEFLL